MCSFNLEQHEIAVEKIHRNLAPSALYEHAILYEKDAHIAENGARRKGEGRVRPCVRLGCSDQMSQRPERDSDSPQCLIRQSRLRGGGEEASQSFLQELCDL
jgi:hypothetical protein